MRRPSTIPGVACASALAFAGWTALTLRTDALADLDASSRHPGLSMSSTWGQLTAALSFTFHPYLFYVLLLGAAVWAWRLRMRSLAWSLLLAPLLAWGSTALLKDAFQRPRPADAIPIATASGWGYPSAHTVGVTVFAIMVSVIGLATRQHWMRQLRLRAGSVVLVAYVAYNRWALRAHTVTDIVGGALWGLFIATLCLWISRVHLGLAWGRRTRDSGGGSLAVVVNPTKVKDWSIVRAQVEDAARHYGWGRPLWLETTPDDTGQEVARRAVARGATLVLAAGGDGTVRAVCEGLTGSEAAIGIIPSGTGNLLARNLGIPLDVSQALDVALSGTPRRVDVVEITADDRPPQVSVVMAGMGVDAAIMNDTNPDLKKAVGHAAYAVAAVGAMSRPAFELTIEIDDEPPATRRVGLALIANVGEITAGIQLVPKARIDDGLLDLLLASADTPAAWTAMAGRVFTRASSVDGLTHHAASHVRLTASEPVPYQIDGDTPGTATVLEASALVGALSIALP